MFVSPVNDCQVCKSNFLVFEFQVVNKFGADALRLYLINSPVVRAENLRFKEEGVRDVLKDVFLPWYNAYRFFVQNVLILTSVSFS